MQASPNRSALASPSQGLRSSPSQPLPLQRTKNSKHNSPAHRRIDLSSVIAAFTARPAKYSAIVPRMKPIHVRPMRAADIAAVSAFADRTIGDRYYPEDEIAQYLERACVEGPSGPVTTAYIAQRDAGLVGFRLVMPPGRWDSGRGAGLTPQRWPRPLAQTAYFQSCFVDPACTGRRLAHAAMDDLRRIGAKAIAVHSWKESPNDSSRRYLVKLGFAAVAEHPRYWADVDYLCVGCKVQPCTCTAIEMILDLETQ